MSQPWNAQWHLSNPPAPACDGCVNAQRRAYLVVGLISTVMGPLGTLLCLCQLLRQGHALLVALHASRKRLLVSYGRHRWHEVLVHQT